MSKFGRGSRTLLEQIGDYDSPDEADKQRIKDRLALTLAAGSLGGATAVTASSKSWASALGVLSGLPVAAKGGLAVVAAASSWAVAVTVVSSQAEAPSAPASQLVVQDTDGAEADGVLKCVDDKCSNGRSSSDESSSDESSSDEPSSGTPLANPVPSMEPPLQAPVIAHQATVREQYAPSIGSRLRPSRHVNLKRPVHISNEAVPAFTEAADPEPVTGAGSVLRVELEAEYLLAARRALSRVQLAEVERTLGKYFQEFPTGALHAEARTLQERLRCYGNDEARSACR